MLSEPFGLNIIKRVRCDNCVVLFLSLRMTKPGKLLDEEILEEEKGESEEEEEEEEDEEYEDSTQELIEIENPNLAKTKNVKAKNANIEKTTELSRCERDEIEKQKAHEQYLRLQEQGKTEQAKKDLGNSGTCQIKNLLLLNLSQNLSSHYGDIEGSTPCIRTMDNQIDLLSAPNCDKCELSSQTLGANFHGVPTSFDPIHCNLEKESSLMPPRNIVNVSSFSDGMTCSNGIGLGFIKKLPDAITITKIAHWIQTHDKDVESNNEK
ncbi:hypothetical protein FNV43_RR15287 [Rhamnella rubrinervis]|uniref:Casein kinase substrate phosphoprotein PP28 domain-containing protein n=1 Tax=Rhamnella rubrinervis TaxID=2594499 RepID=A0A8K0GXC3_9ROSA|nr:hypothetical protein FNV43_RR15287 [Rhamnella rubrinervis]